MDLELDEQLQNFLDDSSVTPEMLRYAARLQIATDELKKHEELNNIKLTKLSEQTAIKLRLYAKCIGITYAHWVSKKEDLCQMIMNRHAELSQVPGTEQTAMVTESTTPPEQRPLKIGEPKAYDTEEYFDLRIVQNVYSDYPVEFIEEKKTFNFEAQNNGNLFLQCAHCIVSGTLQMLQTVSQRLLPVQW